MIYLKVCLLVLIFVSFSEEQKRKFYHQIRLVWFDITLLEILKPNVPRFAHRILTTLIRNHWFWRKNFEFWKCYSLGTHVFQNVAIQNVWLAKTLTNLFDKFSNKFLDVKKVPKWTLILTNFVFWTLMDTSSCKVYRTER